MGIIENTKEMVALVQRVGNLGLYRRIVDLQREVVSLASKNVELEAENRALRAELSERQSVTFRQGYCWRDGDPVPCCPNCKEGSGRLAHLSEPGVWNGGIRRTCRVCRTVYDEKPMNPIGSRYLVTPMNWS